MNDKKLLLNIDRGKRLKKARKYLNVSQRELGERCGLTYADIKNRESGLVQIKQIFATSLEKEWGINSNWLLTGQGEMKATRTVAQDSETLKDKYIYHIEKDLNDALEKIGDLQRQIDRLSSPSTGADQSAASSGKGET
jgi:transcriptional regulator with XRE-family HTH domain